MAANILFLSIGILIGWSIGCYLVKIDGVFHIDDTNEEKTRWTLQMHSEPEDIKKKKCVRFRVHVDE